MMGPRPAFTLLELMVVMVLVAIMTGLVTLGLVDTSESARVQSTIDQFSALVRAAHLHASNTGRPVMIESKSNGFRLRKPVREKDTFIWHEGVWALIEEPVRIEALHLPGETSTSSPGGRSWTALVRPGDWLSRYQLSVGYGERAVATIVIAALGPASEVVWERK